LVVPALGLFDIDQAKPLRLNLLAQRNRTYEAQIDFQILHEFMFFPAFRNKPRTQIKPSCKGPIFLYQSATGNIIGSKNILTKNQAEAPGFGMRRFGTAERIVDFSLF